MIADEGWRITIHGGFAWVFEGDRDNTGVATSVTVGPYSKGTDHKQYHPHRMMLRVAEGGVNTERTTLKYDMAAGQHVFTLEGDVALNAEATREIRRPIHADRPNDWNSFYWVYDADRFADRSGTKRTRPGNWREALDARLLLRGGSLRVLAPRFPGVYEMTYGKTTVRQPLATHIEYHPDWRSQVNEIQFKTPSGDVVARPTLPDGRPTHFDIAAECGCLNEPDLGEIAGFQVTFDLFAKDVEIPRFVPRCTGYLPPPDALMPPGPDCPPRSYSF